MRIRYLVDGHTPVVVGLEKGLQLLEKAQKEGNIIIDDDTQQLAKIEFLNEDSRVTVWPVPSGG